MVIQYQVILPYRFVTVTLTGQSSLPSADGQVRLDKVGSLYVRIAGINILCGISDLFANYCFCTDSSFWALSLRIIVSIGTAPKVQQE